jgi:hypothetical protein
MENSFEPKVHEQERREHRPRWNKLIARGLLVIVFVASPTYAWDVVIAFLAAIAVGSGA